MTQFFYNMTTKVAKKMFGKLKYKLWTLLIGMLKHKYVDTTLI